MAYKVTIEYRPVDAASAVVDVAADVCSTFRPIGSYIDSDVYVGGGPRGTGDLQYGKSVYATNVPGNGSITLPEPFATTSVPFPTSLAQFKLATIGEKDMDAEGTIYYTTSFTVEDYKEAFYYMEVGKALADQGFIVGVEDLSAEADEDEPASAEAGE